MANTLDIKEKPSARGVPDEAEPWTTRHPGLGTEKISYESVISPEFYEVEREAVFRRSWLFMGRLERLKGRGAYFTKELEVLKTSLIIVRGRDDKIRAFHNTCPHRGNKLMWEGHPAREVSGRCARFVCKYHGLGFGTDGKMEMLTAPTNWFENQGQELALAEVPLEIRGGFIYVNLDPAGPRQSLREYLGEHMWAVLDAYPFDQLTTHFSLVGTSKSNWKILQDAFSEGFHFPYLHKALIPSMAEAPPTADMTPYAVSYTLSDPHRQAVSPGLSGERPMYPIEKLGRGGPIGPQYKFPFDFTDLSPDLNPTSTNSWAATTNAIFPNMQMHVYYPGWYLTYGFWPLAYNEMKFEIDCYFPPVEKFSDVMAHATGISFLADAFLQDLNTLEATQRGLEARAFKTYPLIDEEILVRHFHKMIHKAIDAYKAENGIG